MCLSDHSVCLHAAGGSQIIALVQLKSDFKNSCIHISPTEVKFKYF